MSNSGIKNRPFNDLSRSIIFTCIPYRLSRFYSKY
nr:MAG TPA: hypothetical protein [Caudoviricetes sp.]